MARKVVDEGIVNNHYTQPHWVRVITKAQMKIGEKKRSYIGSYDQSQVRHQYYVKGFLQEGEMMLGCGHLGAEQYWHSSGERSLTGTSKVH